MNDFDKMTEELKRTNPEFMAFLDEAKKEHPEFVAYVLERGQVVEKHFLESVLWRIQNDPNVDRTEISNDCEVVTSFINVALPPTDHLKKLLETDETPPYVFETLVCGGPFNDYKDRYQTLAEAKAGHWHIVDALKNGVHPSDHKPGI